MFEIKARPSLSLGWAVQLLNMYLTLIFDCDLTGLVTAAVVLMLGGDPVQPGRRQHRPAVRREALHPHHRVVVVVARVALGIPVKR